MDVINEHKIGGYHYQIRAQLNSSETYEGVILVTAYAGTPYTPVVEIRTPSFFQTQRAAHIEAEVLAVELISTGKISKLLPTGMDDPQLSEP